MEAPIRFLPAGPDEIVLLPYGQHRTVNGPAVGGIVNFALELPGSGHRIGTGVLQHVHPVVGVGSIVSGKVDIPFIIAVGILQIVHFRRPHIGAVHGVLHR
ncbi:hypothetical protein D3C75_805590 [compost metagenome]